MDCKITEEMRSTRAGQVAGEILRKCVHCGFCTATCPTYQLFGDELDGPRGRIYLIKQVLEGGEVTDKTRLHLDRCLSCRSCETTCPSGVEYGHLLDVGRKIVEDRLQRPLREALPRALLKTVLPEPALFGPAVKLGRAFKPLLPSALADHGRPGVGTLGACWCWPVACSRRWPRTSMQRRLACSTGWASNCSRRRRLLAAGPCAFT
jgi:glycolate oxidase iron-sulfur subunit